jgi:PAS domain S-box-containing protein
MSMIFYKDKLRVIRKQQNLNINDLAALIGKSPSAISAWEKGTRNPSEATIRMLARVLQIQVGEISNLTEITSFEEGDIQLLKGSDNTYYNDARELENIFENAKEYINNIKKHSAQATQAELLLNAFLTSMPLMFYLKNKKLNYIKANKTFLDHISVGENNILNKSDFELFAKDEAEENNKEDLEILKTGKPVLLQERLLISSNKKKWALVSKVPVKDPFGDITGIVGTFIDITNRKNAENTRAILEKVINKLEENIWIASLGSESEYIFINDATNELFGISKSKFYDKLGIWVDLIYAKDKTRIENWFKNSSYPKKAEYRIVRPDGQLRWISHTIHYLDIPNMYPIHFGIKQDITEIKRSERLLSLLKNLTDNLTDCAIYIKPTFPKSNFIYLSKSIENIFNSTKTCYQNDMLQWIDFINPENEEKFISFCKNSDSKKELQFEITSSNTKNKTLSISSFLDLDDDNEAIECGIIKVIR